MNKLMLLFLIVCMGIYLIYNSINTENFNGDQQDAAKILAGTSGETSISGSGSNYVPLNKIFKRSK